MNFELDYDSDDSSYSGMDMYFGKKKKKKAVKKTAPKKKKTTSTSAGNVMIKGKARKCYRGSKGGIFYKTKSGGKVYVEPAEIKRSQRERTRVMKPKRGGAYLHPGRPRNRYGYGLGQPSLADMMGPAGLSLVPPMPVAPVSAMKFGGRYY